MIVIDVETTGTNPHKHSIVSLGAIDIENPHEQLYEECRVWEGAHIDPGALTVNGYTEEQITDPIKQTEAELVEILFAWLASRDSLVIAAHNPHFDLSFLEAAAGRAHLNYILPARSIDLHTVCFTHMVKRGVKPPLHDKKSALNSDAVMEYVGIPSEPKPHIALNGAIWEAEAFSRLLFDKNLLPDFSKYPLR
jgi:DNA polymerase III epsilon subunit-like protein